MTRNAAQMRSIRRFRTSGKKILVARSTRRETIGTGAAATKEKSGVIGEEDCAVVEKEVITEDIELDVQKLAGAGYI